MKVYNTQHLETPTSSDGIAFVLNKTLISTYRSKAKEVIPRKAIELQIRWTQGRTVKILGIYAPLQNGREREKFFMNITEHYQRKGQQKPEIILGDFNMVKETIDRAPATDPNDKLLDALDTLKNTLNIKITDGWRATYPYGNKYTWRANQQNGATQA